MDIDITTKTFDERDEFQRRNIAEKAIKLLKSDVDISPMVIDGSWGTGKTEFCHKLINLMKEDNTHNVIYIDAFKADHINEPLMTVLAEIIKILPNEPARKKFIKKVLPTVRFSLKALAKAGVSHLLRQDFANVTNDFDKEIQKAANKAIDTTAELMLKDHVEAEKNLQTLQAALTAIASQDPIVIFIDELDRCRPNFAVDMLEIIKHTFDVEGVSFVLITNTQQLKASINHCYGQAVDAQRYLDKFVKFRFELSRYADVNLSNLAASNYFFELVKEKEIMSINFNNNIGVLFKEAIKYFIKFKSLSLREIESLIRYIQIAQTLAESELFRSGQPLGKLLLDFIGLSLFCFQSELLIQAKDRNLKMESLGDFLGVSEIPELENRYIKNTVISGNSIGKQPDAFVVMMVVIAHDFEHEEGKYTPAVQQKSEWDFYKTTFMGELPHKNEIRSRLLEIESLMSFTK